MVSGEGPVSLLQQVCAILVQLGGHHVHMRFGMLMVLCAWLVDRPVAVSHFLQNRDENIGYLTSQAGKQSLVAMVRLYVAVGLAVLRRHWWFRSFRSRGSDFAGSLRIHSQPLPTIQ